MTQKNNHYNHCTEKGGRWQTYSSPAYKTMDIHIKQTRHRRAAFLLSPWPICRVTTDSLLPSMKIQQFLGD